MHGHAKALRLAEVVLDEVIGWKKYFQKPFVRSKGTRRPGRLGGTSHSKAHCGFLVGCARLTGPTLALRKVEADGPGLHA